MSLDYGSQLLAMNLSLALALLATALSLVSIVFTVHGRMAAALVAMVVGAGFFYLSIRVMVSLAPALDGVVH